MPGSRPSVRFEVFRSALQSWPALFQKAAGFAETIGPERLIGISQSQESIEGIVTVWYWSDEAANHLSDDRLELYVNGGLSHEDATGVSAHLRNCAECRDRLVAMEGYVDDLRTPSVERNSGEGGE